MAELYKKEYKLDENIKIAVIGLGYVGLPLARLFATKFPVIGFDINESRVSSLKSRIDTTLKLKTGFCKVC